MKLLESKVDVVTGAARGIGTVSYTHLDVYKRQVCISNNFLTPEDHILFIDDFLAYGNAAMGMVELAEQSGAVIEGMGFIIEKAFQDGGNLLREKGIRVESLAIIDNLDDCKITVR